ncbi:MAG TPA: hypothetical protein VNF72_20995 [Myxococcota bacterium]|jgi:hypothetical protein|nr:hypothetical protein [Myxococcota bacterium]
MRAGLVRFGVTLALLAGAAQADPAPTPQGSTTGKAPAVGLDSLLKLPPSGASPGEARAGGVTRQEWEQRFAIARGDVAAAQGAIDKAQQELGTLAKGTENWQMSAPGAQANAENSPMSYRLRQELRKQREELSAAERRLTDLEVEANLAGVPEEWTRPPDQAAPTKKAADP